VTYRLTITEVQVSILPEDNVNHGAYALQVSYRGDGRWAVMHMRWCLGRDGEWEPSPSERDDAWLAEHRFTYEEACALASDAVYDVQVNRISARDVLAKIKASAQA